MTTATINHAVQHLRKAKRELASAAALGNHHVTARYLGRAIQGVDHALQHLPPYPEMVEPDLLREPGTGDPPEPEAA